MHVNVGLLGHFQVTLDAAPARFATDHARALLAYLAVEARTHERTTLAALLWPEQPEAAARQNLRQTLLYLKQALRTHPRLESLLEITPKTVRFLPAAATVDLHLFRQQWAECATHPHQALNSCADCITRLRQAVALYQGEFLTGLFVRNSQPFEEWALFVREQLHRQAVEALHLVTLHAETIGDYAQMEHNARRQLALEPWREEAHRQLMRALALADQGTSALAQYAVCRRVLADELGASPSPDTTALYEQIKSGAFDKVTAPPLHPLTPSPSHPPTPSPPHPLTPFSHNLPTHLPNLVGRAEQLNELRRLVLDRTKSLITLVGMGGSGKTRLALALIEHFVAEPPAELSHGAWFVSLVGVDANQPELAQALATMVLDALRLPAGSQADPLHQLSHALAGRQLLLVLDNFEHLLADAQSSAAATGFVRAVSAASAGVTVLVSSRVSLQLGGEEVFRLEGLAVPDRPTADGASVESVRFFVQQAQHSYPGFHLDADNLSDVIEICRLVNGLPLGIELAATLVPHYSGAEIVQTMRKNLAALVSTRRDSDKRHSRLAAVFEYSWQLLTAREQHLLAQCTIFAGGFSRSAVATIMQATDQEIISLVDKSLLQHRAVGRYELHEMVRQFAAEKLMRYRAEDKTEDNEALQLRYVQFYLGLVADQTENLRHRQPKAVALLRQEHENWRRAWEMGLAQHWFHPLATAIDGLLDFWQTSGRYAEGEALVAASLPIVSSGATQPAAPQSSQTLHRKLWLVLAACHFGQQQYQETIEAAEKAIALAQAAEDEDHLARGLITLAESLSWQGRHAEARPFAEQAFALAQQQGAWAVEIRALITLAWYEETFEQRLGYVAQALQIAQRVGDRHYELLCTQNLAGACENAGYYARSLSYRAQALQLAQASADRYGISEAHFLYGLIHTHLGVYTTALEHFEQALVYTQEDHFIWTERRIVNRMAQVYGRTGRLSAAYELSERARSRRRSDEEPSPFFEFTYGELLAAQGRWTEATLVLQRVLARKRTQANSATPQLLPELAALAQVARRQGDLGQAVRLVAEIQQILDEHPRFSMSEVYFDLFAIHLACYQVLAANGDERASVILTQAYQQLSLYADAIPDPEIRRCYLAEVPANRDLVSTWQTAHSEPMSDGPVAAPPHNLPAYLTPFVGRAREVAELVKLLQQPSTRLLTLVGPGGVGKTRLAVAAAEAILDCRFWILDLELQAEEAQNPKSKIQNLKFPDGLFFVSLASVGDAGALAPAILAALGLTLQSGDPRQGLLQALASKELLLILDNFEQLLPPSDLPANSEGSLAAVGLVMDLLQAAPGVRILVTSRERLNLRGEQLYPLQGLPLASAPTIQDAEAAGAVQLFVESAHRSAPHFVLNEASLPALLRICELVQGMPLGLEMAAVRVDQFALAAIAHEIEQSADFLAFDWHDAPPRQRSMRAVFAWSWRLLTATEQRVLAHLAVFRGGFVQAAAETVAQASLRVLTSLVNKSLLRCTPAGAESGETALVRYELHELVRQFAQEQLAATGAADLVAARHSEYYLAFAAARARRLARNEPQQAMTELQAELANIRRAWAWAAQHGASAVLDQSAYSLWQFYIQTGLAAEGAQNFQLAAAGIEAARVAATATVQTPDHQAAILSKMRAFAAHLLAVQGEYDQAARVAQRALAGAENEPAGEQQAEAKALGQLAWGNAFYGQSQFGAAKTQCDLALHYAQEAQARCPQNELWHDVIVQAQLYIGAVARSLGDYPQAKSHFTQALQYSRQLQKARGEVHAQINLAFTLWSLREDAAARAAYEQVLPLARQLGYRWGEGVALYELASVVRSQGEYSLALELWQQALPILRQCADPLRQVYILANLTSLHCYLGDLAQAAAWHQQLQTLRQTFHPPDGERMALAASARYYHAQGEDEQALDVAQQAWQVVEQMGSPIYQATVLTLLGHIQTSLNLHHEAVNSYRQALTRCEALGAIPQAADAQAGLASFALAQGDLVEAMWLTETLLATLADYPRAGSDEPFLIYLTCYQVLAAHDDPRAVLILQQGYDLLQKYAGSIADEKLRRSFLEDVPLHWALQQEYAATPNAGASEGER